MDMTGFPREFYINLVRSVLFMLGWVLWVHTLWDCSQRDFATVKERGSWIVRIAMIPPWGVLAYWFYGRHKGSLPEAPRAKGTPRA